MSDMDLIFKKKNDEYKQRLQPIKDYIEQATDIVSRFYNLDKEEATKIVKDIIRKSNFKNPRIKYRERDLNGDTKFTVTTILDYIAYVKNNKDIMVPSFTVYFNPKKKKSLHSEFITANVKRRSKHKKLAFKYKNEGNVALATYHDILQKTMKIFNNSLSGAYASMGTILYNPSAHYSLTSITRCVSGIGNAISESMIAGTRHYRDPDVTLSHLTAIVTGVDIDKIKKVVDKYMLWVPTAKELYNDVILKNIIRYWRDPEKEKVIFEYLEKLNPYERAAIAYHNSLYYLRKYNSDFVRNIIDEFFKYDHIEIKTREEAVEIINNSVDWIHNLVGLIKVDMLEGKGVKPDKLTDEENIEIAKLIVNISDVLLKYKDLIRAFFITEVYPPSIAYIKSMVRDAIVLSDTDSTCGTYQDWVEWYTNGKLVINPKNIGVSGIIMTFNTRVIDHYIKQLGINMNISPDKAGILQMKNEFYWDAFANTDVTKHYFAKTKVQEGNVFPGFGDLEVKGVHLIASQVYYKVRDLSKSMMKDILQNIRDNKKLSLLKYLKQVAEIEQEIINKVYEGSPDVLRLSKIKDANSYTLDENHSPYFHHKLWQRVFQHKYGLVDEPPYMAIKIPTIIKSKKDMNEFIDKHLDPDQQEAIRELMQEANKTEIKTFNLPYMNVREHGIPKELLPVVDVNKIVRDNCNVLYIILSSLGFYLKPETRVIDYLDKDGEGLTDWQ